MTTIIEDRFACLYCWLGCSEVYTGIHACVRKEDHRGRHRCVCGATSTGKVSNV
jgi:hypothetical protein